MLGILLGIGGVVLLVVYGGWGILAGVVLLLVGVAEVVSWFVD